MTTTGKTILLEKIVATLYPKKHRLGPQNGSRSSGPEKLLKIVNYHNCPKLFWASWKRWVATYIHLDQSSLFRKQWSPLRWDPGGEGEAFTESESWWAPCLAGDIVLPGLWKAVKNLLLEGLNLFNRSGYIRFMCVEGIFALCCTLVGLILLDRRCLGRGSSGWSIILFTFWTNCEEAKFFSMRYYLGTIFRWDGSWNYLRYSVEMTSQSKNDTTRSRLINNMALPHIWLVQENITDIQWGKIT